MIFAKKINSQNSDESIRGELIKGRERRLGVEEKLEITDVSSLKPSSISPRAFLICFRICFLICSRIFSSMISSRPIISSALRLSFTEISCISSIKFSILASRTSPKAIDCSEPRTASSRRKSTYPSWWSDRFVCGYSRGRRKREYRLTVGRRDFTTEKLC